MKIIISHVRKQHVYRLVYALAKEKRLKLFFTSLYFKKSGFLRRIFSLNKKTEKLIEKRYFNGIPDNKVFLTLIPEPLAIIMNKLSMPMIDFYRERLQDNIVAFLLNFYKCDIFIGYESQSLKSFKKVKQQGGITILDLASVHVGKQIEINEKYSYILNAFKKPNIKHIETMKKIKLDEFKYIDYVITLSEFAKKSCLENGIPEEKIKLIPLGIDTKLFSPKKEYNQDRFEVLFVAGVRHLKGIKDLISQYDKEPRYDLALKISQAYYDKKKFSKSSIWAKKANMMDKESDGAWIMYAKSEYTRGNRELAEDILRLYLANKRSKDAELLLMQWKQGE